MTEKTTVPKDSLLEANISTKEEMKIDVRKCC